MARVFAAAARVQKMPFHDKRLRFYSRAASNLPCPQPPRFSKKNIPLPRDYAACFSMVFDVLSPQQSTPYTTTATAAALFEELAGAFLLTLIFEIRFHRRLISSRTQRRLAMEYP